MADHTYMQHGTSMSLVHCICIIYNHLVMKISADVTRTGLRASDTATSHLPVFVMLFVLVSVETPPRITKYAEQEISYKPNEEQTLNCEATGDPAPT